MIKFAKFFVSVAFKRALSLQRSNMAGGLVGTCLEKNFHRSVKALLCDYINFIIPL